MTKPTINLDNLRVASPCPANWEQMSGNDRVRFCEQCGLNVYNFSAMTSAEVSSLVGMGRRVCGRLYRRPDGTILTQDCPVGLRALRKKLSLKATAALATLLSLWSVGFAQGSKNKKDDGCKHISQWTLQQKKSSKDRDPSLTFTVLDPAGAMIQKATVTLIDEASKRTMVFETDEKGTTALRVPATGNYTVAVKASGFKTLVLRHVALKAEDISQAQVALEIDGKAITVGIIVESPSIEYSNGTTIIRGDMIQKLPIP
jgi:hypothetical protein